MKKKILIIVYFIASFLTALGIGAFAVTRVLSNIIEEYRKSSDRYLRMFQVMSQWLRLRQEGKSIIEYFEKNNYRDIAIYETGLIGECIAREVQGSKVTVKYFIDNKFNGSSDGFMVSPDSELKEVDVIVVTAVSSYGEIKKQLMKKVNCPVISIEDILYEV